MLKTALGVQGASRRLANLPAEWAISSTCSGTGNFELAVEAVANAVNDAKIEGREEIIASWFLHKAFMNL